MNEVKIQEFIELLNSFKPKKINEINNYINAGLFSHWYIEIRDLAMEQMNIKDVKLMFVKSVFSK